MIPLAIHPPLVVIAAVRAEQSPAPTYGHRSCRILSALGVHCRRVAGRRGGGPYGGKRRLPPCSLPLRLSLPGCGRFVKRPYDIHALFSVGRDLCVPPCPVAVSHASYPHNAAPPPGWPGGGAFFVFAFHAKWRSKLPVVDTPSSTMTKAWGSISAMAWRREAISYLFRHTHSTCTGLSVKPP